MNATTELPPSSTPTVLCLSPLVTASSLASASRNAWRVFLEQSEGWGKAELVLWSGGLYAPIARHASELTARRGDEPDNDYRYVDPHFVERMISIARSRLIEVLQSFELPRARLAFSRAMNAEGAVTRCQDGAGDIGFAPTPATDSLADRVLSLVAADLFARPGDFEGEMLCSCCGGIVMGRTPCCASSRYDVPSSSVIAKPANTVAVPLAG
jgi:hypothetical protein